MSIFEKVTARILEQLESAQGDWTAPWIPVGFSEATNAKTGAQYQGGNAFILGLMGGGYWATYKQWQELGAQVRKGETGVPCIKWVESRKKGDSDEKEQGFLFPASFVVFTSEQIDGWIAPQQAEPRAECERIGAAESIINATCADIRHKRQDRAYYVIEDDYISLPEIDQFTTSEEFYATVMHELTHWTGHKSRLGRFVVDEDFKRSDYALEELVAEIGAAFLLAKCGLSAEPRQDHAEYISRWIKYCEQEPQLILKAATKAQKAVDYILSFSNAEQK